ncbi:Xylose isomerase domain protein TIM barrel [Chloroherpeton thalassium ATCC 35110]|uniref:Xylose isomerase domain protein TIM barrel n=1 Tax=Chloroherpeton thalassium (strain ATCC 35110 / GB-78) TaxID=517418 RepID=B3QW28_CHLT3|nr:TIM barrel protein [Chloroherpeton thalassium]ACF14682.1 Xylose isomerase domain protein TIM barrel [Chloroherpeton thalassium ATCC 35110]
MNFLLNISTYSDDLELINHDWASAEKLLAETGFSGFELYPVGKDYPYQSIPTELIGGVHLRFFIMLEAIWRNDRAKLIEIFGDEETVRTFYGGTTRDAIVDCYRHQLELAHQFHVPYVVFHPVHYELDYVFNWQPPWKMESTLALSAEVLNAVLAETPYQGWVLLENLWWPENFRLDSTSEIDFLLGQIDYAKTGIVLDTGHLLNKNQSLGTEREGIEYLLNEIKSLGRHRDLIKAVHLTKSISRDYVRQTKGQTFNGEQDFWKKLSIAARHVRQIDQHNAFEDAAIAELFELISPDHVVFEFAYRSISEWKEKIALQKKALGSIFQTCITSSTPHFSSE